MFNILWKTFVLIFSSLINRKFKRTDLFEIEIFCNIRNVLTVTSDQFNVSSLNIIINSFNSEKK